MTGRRAIWRAYKASLFARTYFVDEEIAAIFGMAGSFLSGVGEPWLMTSEVVEKRPVTFIKEVRRSVDQMLALKSKLRGMVHADYPQACKMLELIGFTLGEPQKVGNAMFREYTMERD